MKIKLTNPRSQVRKRLLFTIMKTYIFLLCTTVFSVTTENSFSQEKIIINKNQFVTIDQVFKIIKQQTSYRFIYPKNLFKDIPKIQLKKGRIKIAKLLKQSLYNNNFDYRLTKNNITIIEKIAVISTEKQQQREIKGTVTDSEGTPLPGVNILVKGTNFGTSTDFDGKFTLEIPDDAKIIVVSYLGFETQEIAVEGKSNFDIELEEDAGSLEEIVVIGYGSVAKKDLTGAVGSVKVDDVSISATTSIDAALGGRVSGLVAVQTSGQPGAGASIQIRGNASFASSGVLYVVDGVPINGGAGEPRADNGYGGAYRSPLNFINPNDIESVEVLKDASSAAIYGARAGAGVVLITTKKGKIGKVRVSFNHSYAFQNLLDFYEVYTERDYMINRNGYERERWMLSNNVGVYGDTDPSTLPPLVPIYSDSDIQGARTSGSALDEIQRKGYLQQYNVRWDWALFKKDSIDFSKPVTNNPNDLGFDYAYGHCGSLDMPPFVYVENGMATAIPTKITVNRGHQSWWRKGLTSPDFAHKDVTPNFIRRAVSYVAEKANDKKPFFLYVPLPSPHTPILPTEEFQGKSGLDNPYADFVMMVDAYIGKLLAQVKSSGIEKNMLIIFTSDNGCSPQANFKQLISKGHNPSGIYRGHKADIFEGGHRVPFIVKWPQVIEPGTTNEQIICTTDFISTVATITNYKLKDNEAEDSFNMMPLLTQKSTGDALRKTVIHHSIRGSFAIRRGNYKLIMCPGSGGWSFPKPNTKEAKALPKVQLYDLSNNPREKNNLQDDLPEIVRELKELLTQQILEGRSTAGLKQQNDTGTYWKQLWWMEE